MAAKRDFGLRREPSKPEAVCRGMNKRRFREAHPRGDPLHPARAFRGWKKAHGGRVALKMPVDESVNKPQARPCRPFRALSPSRHAPVYHGPPRRDFLPLRREPGSRRKCCRICRHGRVAQLGERLVRNEEVSGSIPLTSIRFPVRGVSRRRNNAAIRQFPCGPGISVVVHQRGAWTPRGALPGPMIRPNQAALSG